MCNARRYWLGDSSGLSPTIHLEFARIEIQSEQNQKKNSKNSWEADEGEAGHELVAVGVSWAMASIQFYHCGLLDPAA